MSAAGPVVDELRAALVAAAQRDIERRRRRRRRRHAVLTAVAAGLAGTLGLAVRSPTTAAADVLVRVDHDRVVVRLVELEHDPDRIARALRAAGLDVAVDAAPVGPSLVGRFLGGGSSGPLPPELQAVDGDTRSFAGFVVPLGWDGSLRLVVGEPAGAGDRYARFSDALAPGEPLACRPLLGRPALAVARQLDHEPLTVRYLAVEPTGLRGVHRAHLDRADLAGRVVHRADAVAPHEVVLHLARPDAEPGPPVPTPGCP